MTSHALTQWMMRGLPSVAASSACDLKAGNWRHIGAAPACVRSMPHSPIATTLSEEASSRSAFISGSETPSEPIFQGWNPIDQYCSGKSAQSRLYSAGEAEYIPSYWGRVRWVCRSRSSIIIKITNYSAPCSIRVATRSMIASSRFFSGWKPAFMFIPKNLPNVCQKPARKDPRKALTML